ncbi:sugar ABC transporter permease [Paenibacillus mesophilus]|uniref:ABC transporter permease n=1 Tax=Paenibacillus mesophilus TaxID=2582849 RepID=UPI00110DBF16|nr:sugar ABC transporter permease [Paenibacillus mesophilus]TMV44210.1 sugar ABC transporter permease [Paenibacillus mesophilus]
MTAKTEPLAPKRAERVPRGSGWKSVRKNWELYLFVLPTVAYFIVFHYFPMYGLQIAFRDYTPSLGIWNSPWVGLEHLERFFQSYYFWTLIKNTIGISLYELVVGFPVPIVLALALNELRGGAFKKWVQTVTYAPHFISVVVMAGMIIAFASPGSGLINLAIKAMGGEPIPFLTEPGWFKTVFVLSGVWQNMGWGTIIYLAALAGVDPQQHEAAMIDGASRFQRVWHINLPSIVPTMVILLILNVGSFMSVGFEKVFLLQNPLNLESSDVISTYVYRSGLVQGQFSFSAAIGLFNSVINFVLLLAVNRIAKRLSETSLW